MNNDTEKNIYLEDADLNKWAILIAHHRREGGKAQGWDKNRHFKIAGRYLEYGRNRVKEIGGRYPEWLNLIGFRDFREDGTKKFDVSGRAYIYRRLHLYWKVLKQIMVREIATGEVNCILHYPTLAEDCLSVLQGKKDPKDLRRGGWNRYELILPDSIKRHHQDEEDDQEESPPLTVSDLCDQLIEIATELKHRLSEGDE